MAFLCLLFTMSLKAQVVKSYPEIAKPCPEFSLPVASAKKNLSLADFKGKSLILYFFSSGCSVSFESLPKLKDINEEFADQLDFLMIGKKDNESKILYEKFADRYELNFHLAYDSKLFDSFGVRVVPHLVWIDDKGIVKAITSPTELNKDNISSFLTDERFNLPEKPNAFQEMEESFQYDMDKPLLINGNGGPDTAFIYRSIITTWNKKIPCANRPFISSRFGNQVQLVCMSLSGLYNYAYNDTTYHTPQYEYPTSYGIYFNKPILELKDSSTFLPDYDLERNIYCYSLTVPKTKAIAKHMQEIMKTDLYNYFGYHVRVETRKMPYWKLTATEHARKNLKTKGKKKYYPFKDYADFSLYDAPVGVLLAHLWLFHNDEPPFIDETGISGNIDLHVDAFSNDSLDLIRKALQKKGLDLVKGEREMKVIVITD